MNVNNALVNNQYNQVGKNVLSTGATTNGKAQENAQLQEQIDEYIEDTFSFGNTETEAEKNYRETLERLQAFAKQFFLDSMAKDRTFIQVQGPKPGEEIPFEDLLPGWSENINFPMPDGLNDQPTGNYDPVVAMKHHNALIGYLNDWSKAMDANQAKLGAEMRRRLQVAEAEWHSSGDAEKARELTERINSMIVAMPTNKAKRIDDMSPEELMSYGFFKQQVNPGAESE